MKLPEGEPGVAISIDVCVFAVSVDALPRPLRLTSPTSVADVSGGNSALLRRAERSPGQHLTSLVRFAQCSDRTRFWLALVNKAFFFLIYFIF